MPRIINPCGTSASVRRFLLARARTTSFSAFLRNLRLPSSSFSSAVTCADPSTEAVPSLSFTTSIGERSRASRLASSSLRSLSSSASRRASLSSWGVCCTATPGGETTTGAAGAAGAAGAGGGTKIYYLPASAAAYRRTRRVAVLPSRRNRPRRFGVLSLFSKRCTKRDRGSALQPLPSPSQLRRSDWTLGASPFRARVRLSSSKSAAIFKTPSLSLSKG